jgi:hypothetical protein
METAIVGRSEAAHSSVIRYYRINTSTGSYTWFRMIVLQQINNKKTTELSKAFRDVSLGLFHREIENVYKLRTAHFYGLPTLYRIANSSSSTGTS